MEDSKEDHTADSSRDEEAGEEGSHSTVDAMGQDKRRTIIGQGYGPGKARQFLYYGIAILVVVGIYFGAKIAISELDKAPAKDADKAPWSKVQTPPRPFE